MKYIKFILLLFGMISAGFLCQRIIHHSKENQQLKSDYAELNSIKYGLFSLDVWKENITTIVVVELDRLYVSNQTEAQMKKHVAAIMDKIIDKAAQKIEQANQKTTTGKVKQAFIDTFVDIKDIKKGIPEYADAVMKEMKKPKTGAHSH